MNCKPGDLAITHGMHDSENNGVIVEVLSLSDPRGIWLCRTRFPMREIETRQLLAGEGHLCDQNLRPISGVPVHDEVLDEVVA